MRLLTLAAVSWLALAGPGCTAIGAGTGAIAAVSANHIMGPGSPRIPVGLSTVLGAVMGLVIDIAVLSALDHAFDPLHSCPSCD